MACISLLPHFVTSYARNKTIRSAQKIKDKFMYADTDSLHIHIKLPEKMKNMSSDELENLTTKDLIEMGVDIPEDFEIHPTKLGAWKVESLFYRARYLRQKCYIEDENPQELWDKPQFHSGDLKETCEDLGIDFEEEIKRYEGWYDRKNLKITCAGMPDDCYSEVSWTNFFITAEYSGKLIPERVPGGIVLKDTKFTIHRD